MPVRVRVRMPVRVRMRMRTGRPYQCLELSVQVLARRRLCIILGGGHPLTLSSPSLQLLCGCGTC